MKTRKMYFVMMALVFFTASGFSQDLFGIKNLYPKIAEMKKLSPEEKELRRLEIEAKTLRLKDEIRIRRATEKRIADSLFIVKRQNDSIVAEYVRVDSIFEANKVSWEAYAVEMSCIPVIKKEEIVTNAIFHNSIFCEKLQIEVLPEKEKNNFYENVSPFGGFTSRVINEEKGQKQEKLYYAGIRYNVVPNFWVGTGFIGGSEEFHSKSHFFLETSFSILEVRIIEGNNVFHQSIAKIFARAIATERSKYTIGCEFCLLFARITYEYSLSRGINSIGAGLSIPASFKFR